MCNYEGGVLFVGVTIEGHPRFFNQLSTGLDIVCLAGEWLTATANTNMSAFHSITSIIVVLLTGRIILQKNYLRDCRL